jgi:hypothetical protein
MSRHASPVSKTRLLRAAYALRAVALHTQTGRHVHFSLRQSCAGDMGNLIAVAAAAAAVSRMLPVKFTVQAYL